MRAGIEPITPAENQSQEQNNCRANQKCGTSVERSLPSMLVIFGKCFAVFIDDGRVFSFGCLLLVPIPGGEGFCFGRSPIIGFVLIRHCDAPYLRLSSKRLLGSRKPLITNEMFAPVPAPPPDSAGRRCKARAPLSDPNARWQARFAQ